MFIFNFVLSSDTAAISLVNTFANSNIRINKSIPLNILYSSGKTHERVRRASSSEISGAEHGVGLSSTLQHYEGVVLGIAAVFCLSLMMVVMCVFCDGCDEEKSADVGGPSGYVGEIDLADIRVVYNPSAGAPQLPHTHHNEAFEDVVLGNPAILQVSSCEGVSVGLSNGHRPTAPDQNSVLREIKSNALPSRGLIKDEQGNVVMLGYENLHGAGGFRTDLARNQTENSSGFPVNIGESAVQSSAAQVHSTASVNASRNYFVSGRDYDMNDITIKNMNARY